MVSMLIHYTLGDQVKTRHFSLSKVMSASCSVSAASESSLPTSTAFKHLSKVGDIRIANRCRLEEVRIHTSIPSINLLN